MTANLLTLSSTETEFLLIIGLKRQLARRFLFLVISYSLF